jgi:DNA-binding CsgD family transcriptional regulator
MLTYSTDHPESTFRPFFAQPNLTEQILLDLPQAILVLLPSRKLVFANANAEVLLARGLARDGHGCLTKLGQLGATPIDELLRRAHDGRGTQIGLWFPNMQTGWLNASRIPSGIASGADWPQESLLLLIHLDEPKLSQPARIDALCERHGLTRTERYVLLLLADGMPAQDIARQLALRISTVRTHVRSLLGKTGLPSLMQLVRQVGSTEPLEACP